MCRGVGYGICQRLLVQLCQRNAPDAQPQAFSSELKLEGMESAPEGYQGLTLIMACRNAKRAEAARANLLSWLEGHTKKLLKTCSKEDAEYLRNFRTRCVIQIMELDLASVSSTLKFADSVRKRWSQHPLDLYNKLIIAF